MLKRKLWTQFPCLLFGFFACVTLWHLVEFETSYTFRPAETVYTLYEKGASYVYPMHLLPPNDYNQLLSLSFSFDILNPVESGAGSLLLIVLVHSSPGNFEKRKVIRETWGERNDGKVKVFFAIGSVVSEKTQAALEKENSDCKDLVQGSFIDGYRNMTYKHVMVFKYVIYHFPQAKYIMKTDDDVFVNMPTLRNFLTNDMSPYGAANVLFCNLKKDLVVIRTYRSKWRVSFADYPDRKYPAHCPGWILLYSPDVVFNLYRTAQATKEYFWIDDVYITGTLANKVGVHHTDIEPFVIPRKITKRILAHSQNTSAPFLFGTYNLNEKTIRGLWKYVKTHPVPKYVKNLEFG